MNKRRSASMTRLPDPRLDDHQRPDDRGASQGLYSLQRSAGNAAVAGLVESTGPRSLLMRADAPAVDEAAQKAEVNRLLEELVRLMQKNAYGGIIRTYEKLEAIDHGSIPREGHSQAAKADLRLNGATTRYVELLTRAISGPASDDDPQVIENAQAELRAFIENWQQVRIGPAGSDAGPAEDEPGKRGGLFGGKKDPPEPTSTATLVTPGAFDPIWLAALKVATEKLATTGTYRGFLLIGEYTLNDAPLTVSAGLAEQQITY